MKYLEKSKVIAAIVFAVAAGAAGCVQTKSEVDVKPVDINLNITGRLEVVITDARKQEEQITGAAPKRTVRPEDIGLPASMAPTSRANGSGVNLADDGDVPRFLKVADTGASEAQLISQMAARHQQVAAMLNGQLVGESHTGYMVAKASLSGEQQAIVDAENADRRQLYALEAAKKNTSVDQVALGYYLARLEHVNKGAWVERFNKSTNAWEWFQWDR
ncbi:MAG TPA: DUF1318 domain-containing protein [Candidatus Acidoferrales bacterium]|nr:DUF1318 domain-containing protein [Candidatus Acidoferrales bacterium]